MGRQEGCSPGPKAVKDTSELRQSKGEINPELTRKKGDIWAWILDLAGYLMNKSWATLPPERKRLPKFSRSHCLGPALSASHSMATAGTCTHSFPGNLFPEVRKSPRGGLCLAWLRSHVHLGLVTMTRLVGCSRCQLSFNPCGRKEHLFLYSEVS